MKKTLCGALAFVFLLSALLTGSAFAMASDATKNVGAIPLVSADQPIHVDGDMDMVYASSPELKIDMPNQGRPEHVFTHGYARFAWSEAEKAIYCYVLVNDEELLEKNKSAWNVDSVELFLDFTNNGGHNIVNDNGEAVKWLPDVLSRGLQYRISGYSYMPTAYLDEDGERKTYQWDPEKGRLYADGGKLITDKVNNFGWTYDELDDTKRGWAAKNTANGYAVEFKITNANLTAGQAIGFDLAINDVYAKTPTANERYVIYYRSAYREAAPKVEDGNDCTRYDYFTLGSTVVANPGNVSSLEQFGMAPATAYATSATEAIWTTTEKVTFSRATGTTRPSGADATTTTRPAGTTKPAATTTAPAGSSGCGSSIAIGSSVAMVALIGAAGFVTLRKKKD